VVAQPRHVPGEAGDQVDFALDLEVDEELGLLRRANAVEVPQALIRPASVRGTADKITSPQFRGYATGTRVGAF
jgi:hypothetical protein